jgi:hypothetical protein
MVSFRPRPPYPVQNFQYPLSRSMCGSLGLTGRFEEKENFLPLPGFKSRIVQSYDVLSKYSINPFTLAITSDIFTVCLLCKKIIGYNQGALYRHFREISKSEYKLHHVCPSVRPHGATRFLLDSFS